MLLEVFTFSDFFLRKEDQSAQFDEVKKDKSTTRGDNFEVIADSRREISIEWWQQKPDCTEL